MKILNIILFFICFSCNAQNVELIIKTQSKLKNDTKSFEQFVFYGFCNCTDKYLYSETFADNYITTFNRLEPFPRFFEKDSIKVVLDELQHSRKENFINLQDKFYNGYLVISKCYTIYHINSKDLKKSYNLFIKNKNLQKEWNDDYMKDYLDNYFIKVQTE